MIQEVREEKEEEGRGMERGLKGGVGVGKEEQGSEIIGMKVLKRGRRRDEDERIGRKGGEQKQRRTVA